MLQQIGSIQKLWLLPSPTRSWRNLFLRKSVQFLFLLQESEFWAFGRQFASQPSCCVAANKFQAITQACNAQIQRVAIHVVSIFIISHVFYYRTTIVHLQAEARRLDIAHISRVYLGYGIKHHIRTHPRRYRSGNSPLTSAMTCIAVYLEIGRLNERPVPEK